MPAVTIRMTGATDLLEFHVTIHDNLPRKIHDLVTKIVETGKELTINNVVSRVSDYTTVLPGVFAEVDASGKRGAFGIRHPAAIMLEVGVRPHDIEPVTRQVLKFDVAEGSIFAKHVKHPGYKEKRLVRDAGDELSGKLDAIAKEVGVFDE